VGRGRDKLKGIFRAVFLNYVLDCLPAAILEVHDTELRQLCVRTSLARGAELSDYANMNPKELARIASSADEAHQEEVRRLFGIMASEYTYQPVNSQVVPYGEFALRFAGERARRLVLNYGAIRSLERLLDLLHPQGFILVNDYGQTEVEITPDLEHQIFSQTTAIGLNFPLLKVYFEESSKCSWFAPPGDSERAIHTRLLADGLDPQVVSCFGDRFGKAAFEWIEEPLQRARQCMQVGRTDAARTQYGLALERQPWNWMIINEIALFLIFSLRNPRAGIDMAKLALALNPNCSSELWNTLGDGLFAFGRLSEARWAYGKAITINSNDVRARFNLAMVHNREKEYSLALARIAEGLGLNKSGDYRERLLQLQGEILGHLSSKFQQEAFFLANRINNPPPLPKNATQVGSQVGTEKAHLQSGESSWDTVTPRIANR
jgi:tetratricopeptide (TPR) repeat protein